MFQISLTGHLPMSEVPGETHPAGTAEDVRKAFERAVLELRKLDASVGGTLQGKSDDGSGFVYHAADVPSLAEITKRDRPVRKRKSSKAKAKAHSKAKPATKKPQRPPTASRTARHVVREPAKTPAATASIPETPPAQSPA